MTGSSRSAGQLSNYFVGLFFIFAVTTGATLIYLVNSHHREMAFETAVLTAKTTAENIDHFRSFYSDRVVKNVIDGDIKITHRYHGDPSSIPLPATLSIELGDFMREQAANIDYKIFSDYPFPWRLDRELNGEEVSVLQDRPRDETVIKARDGTIRHFSPVVMGKTCVACHNDHPASPKTDWSVGDVRGYQVVSLPATFGVNAQGHGMGSFNQIVLFFVGAFGSAFFAIIYLVRRNKAAFVRVQEYASSEAQKGKDLFEANTKLEKSLRELNAILDNAADGIITINESGHIVSANSAAEEIFGYVNAELIGKNIKLLMGDVDASGHDVYINKFMKTGQAKIIGVGREVTARRKTGEVFPVELSIGHIQHDDGTYFTGILRDVTDRKQAEKDLKETQEKERMLSLVASLTDNAVIITDAHNRIRWVNDGFEHLSGYKLDEVKGLNPGSILQGAETDRQKVAEMSTAITARKSFDAEIINYAKDGSEYWVQIEAQPIIRGDGKFDGYIAIERDVTKDREKAEELVLAREAAEESSKSKSRFLAMMSHEIRTPLNAVIGGLGLLQDEENNDKRDQFLSTAKKAAENLQSIINDILDISKLEVEALKLEQSVADPSETVRDVISVLEPRALDKGIFLDWSKDPSAPNLANTDFARLRQILINFVSNAIKFTDEGGVKIRLSKSSTSDASIRFEVADTGVGIAPEDIDSIFDEFWTKNLSTENTAPGTGLGLAISKRLTESLGGSIGVSSACGKGAIFWVEIPIGEVSKEDRPDLMNDLDTNIPDTFDGHVLIAEDNSANQLIASAMLEKLGVSADIAANGIEALAALQRREYDIILMDVNMPEMDGVTATQEIRAKGLAKNTPIVAMTANVMKGDEEKLRSQGFDDYLGKPFVGIDLRRVLFRNMSSKPME